MSRFASEGSVDTDRQEARKRATRLQPLKLLFKSYATSLWFWEVVETANRLLLTGVLVIIAQGSAVQIVVGFAIATR